MAVVLLRREDIRADALVLPYGCTQWVEGGHADSEGLSPPLGENLRHAGLELLLDRLQQQFDVFTDVDANDAGQAEAPGQDA